MKVEVIPDLLAKEPGDVSLTEFAAQVLRNQILILTKLMGPSEYTADSAKLIERMEKAAQQKERAKGDESVS